MKRIIKCSLAIISIIALLIPSFTASAAGTMAFSVGTDYGTFEADTSGMATTACDLYAIAGYNSYYTTSPTVSVMKGSFQNGIKRMQSDVLFFAGHGSNAVMSFNYNGSSDSNYKVGIHYTTDTTNSGYTYVGLSGNMGTVKLVTFAGCSTASGTDNLPSRAVSYGADAAVGWTETINASSIENWAERYNDKLATGSTVSEAIAYANSFVYLDSSVKKSKIYGSGNLVIKRVTYSLVQNDDIETNRTIVNNSPIVSKNDEIDIKVIIGEVQKHHSDFTPSKYKTNVYEFYDGCYTVDFVRMVGNVETDSCYTVSIIDNKITDIVDNTKEIDEELINAKASSFYSAANTYSAKICDVAQNEVETSEKKVVENQMGKLVYNTTENSLQYVVKSVYNFDNTPCYGADIHIQTIN